jgi:hypothetical protein
MKLTKNEKKLFIEAHDRWLVESNLLARLFAKTVAKSIKNNKDIQNAVADADLAMEKAKKEIENQMGGNREGVKKAIPADVRRYLGFDY